MTTILVPQLVQNGLQQLIEAIQAWSDAPTELELRDGFYVCFILGDLAERSWEFLRERLSLGMDDAELTTAAQDAVNLGRQVAEAFAQVRKQAQRSLPAMPRSQEDLDRLDSYIQKVAQLQEKTQRLLDWAQTPSSTLDAASIPRKGDPVTGEGFKPAAQLLAEFRQKRS